MKRAFVLAILFILPITVQAATIYVPDDHVTIQAAIDASADGDMVIVRPGTYVENINFNGKAITLQSEQGPEVTIIDANGSGIVVKFNSGEGRGSVLDGFTIQNGATAAQGGGVSMISASSPVIRNNIITGNTADMGGGGIRCRGGSSPLITNNVISNNNADQDGGGILCLDNASPQISNNTISDNSAEYGGGILCLTDSSPQISGNAITNNTASISAGGIYCHSSTSPLISNNTITDNSAEYGGAIFNASYSSSSISNNTITGNTADYGGGIYCNEGSSPLISENTITNNTADYGGGFNCYKSSPLISDNTITNNTANWSGGGIRSNEATPVIINNLVHKNSAVIGAGIFVWCETAGCPPATITGNIVAENTASDGGGGICLTRTTTPVLNNLIVDNVALTRYGAGINVNTDSDVLIANNTIVGNSADGLGGGGIAVILESSATLSNNILWEDSSPTGKEISLHDDSTATVSYCDVDGGQAQVNVEAGSTLNWGTGNIDANPLFVTEGEGEYYLSQIDAGQPEDSLCVDAGDETSPVIGGTTRTDQVPDAGVIDMGYHYPGPARLVVGPGPGYYNPPTVRVFPPESMAAPESEFPAYGPTHYGVNVTCGDVNVNYVDEIITGAGPGDIYGPHVRGFDVNGNQLPGLSFLAYGTNKYGVNVATGDIDADGFDEIITGAGPGAVFGPHVRGWNYDGSGTVTAIPWISYFAYGTPKWGVNVSCGDLDGDGFDEIVTGAGPGAVYGPHVRGWNVDGGTPTAMPGVSFLAYGTNQYGVNVSCGDVDGDGIDEIITGPGPSSFFGAHVRGWNVDGGTATAMANLNFFAWLPDEVRYGAKVFAGADLDGDGRDEIVVGQGPDSEAGTWVKVYLYDGSQAVEWLSIDAFGDEEMTHGVNVAAGHF